MTVLDLAFALLIDWDVYLSTAPTLMSSRASCVCVLRRRVFQVLERSERYRDDGRHERRWYQCGVGSSLVWGSHPDNDG